MKHWWWASDDLEASWRDVVEVIRDHERGVRPVTTHLYCYLQAIKHARLMQAYHPTLMAMPWVMLANAAANIYCVYRGWTYPGWIPLLLLAVLLGAWFGSWRASRGLKHWADRYIDEIHRLVAVEKDTKEVDVG